MAYATVAGLPVEVGLYTAFIPMIIYALLGPSKVLSVSSTTTLGILAGTQLGLAVPERLPRFEVITNINLIIWKQITRRLVDNYPDFPSIINTDRIS
jgi:MFS superfamily sulfate permease-like transporter